MAEEGWKRGGETVCFPQFFYPQGSSHLKISVWEISPILHMRQVRLRALVKVSLTSQALWHNEHSALSGSDSQDLLFLHEEDMVVSVAKSY